ncbi:MAG: TSUP family transporter, partial [Ktedonobacteraceae bacterium]
LKTPQATFEHLIPFLMLAATLLFAVSPSVNTRLKQRAALRQKQRAELRQKEDAALQRTDGSRTAYPKAVLLGIAALQLVIATYGGYFGGGIGILMLASLGIMGMENIHEMNAVKNMLATCINGVAVLIFIVLGAIVWPDALIMVVGAIIGGFGGAYYARKLDPRLVRVFVILVGCTMTLYFLYKYGFF